MCRHGVEAHGAWTTAEVVSAVASSAGVAASERTTDAFLKVTCLAPGGRSGYATQTAVGVGLVGQFTIMPFVGAGLALASGLPPEIAAGVILIGVVPSGLASNVMAYIANANVALSVTLTTAGSDVRSSSVPWSVARVRVACAPASLARPPSPASIVTVWA